MQLRSPYSTSNGQNGKSVITFPSIVKHFVVISSSFHAFKNSEASSRYLKYILKADGSVFQPKHMKSAPQSSIVTYKTRSPETNLVLGLLHVRHILSYWDLFGRKLQFLTVHCPDTIWTVQTQFELSRHIFQTDFQQTWTNNLLDGSDSACFLGLFSSNMLWRELWPSVFCPLCCFMVLEWHHWCRGAEREHNAGKACDAAAPLWHS